MERCRAHSLAEGRTIGSNSSSVSVSLCAGRERGTVGSVVTAGPGMPVIPGCFGCDTRRLFFLLRICFCCNSRDFVQRCFFFQFKWCGFAVVRAACSLVHGNHNELIIQSRDIICAASQLYRAWRRPPLVLSSARGEKGRVGINKQQQNDTKSWSRLAESVRRWASDAPARCSRSSARIRGCFPRTQASDITRRPRGRDITV